MDWQDFLLWIVCIGVFVVLARFERRWAKEERDEEREARWKKFSNGSGI